MKSKFILAIVALAILNLPGIGQEPIYRSGASGSVSARGRFVGSWDRGSWFQPST